MELRLSERTGEQTLYLAKGEPFPSFGIKRVECPHPAQYSTFAEWDGLPGHGWFCALCGEWLRTASWPLRPSGQQAG